MSSTNSSSLQFYSEVIVGFISSSWFQWEPYICPILSLLKSEITLSISNGLRFVSYKAQWAQIELFRPKSITSVGFGKVVQNKYRKKKKKEKKVVERVVRTPRGGEESNEQLHHFFLFLFSDKKKRQRKLKKWNEN